MLMHRPATGEDARRYGENLAIHATVLKGAEAWAAEAKNYAAGTQLPSASEIKNFHSGHYTQMVWRKTTEIGVGKAEIKTGRFKGSFVIVADYNPPGNYIGEKPY
jgi:pathogenesis-related protein 1